MSSFDLRRPFGHDVFWPCLLFVLQEATLEECCESHETKLSQFFPAKI